MKWPLLLDALFDHDPMFSFETSYASSAKLNLYDLLQARASFTKNKLLGPMLRTIK
jgi:hypothetical protein